MISTAVRDGVQAAVGDRRREIIREEIARERSAEMDRRLTEAAAVAAPAGTPHGPRSFAEFARARGLNPANFGVAARLDGRAEAIVRSAQRGRSSDGAKALELYESLIPKPDPNRGLEEAVAAKEAEADALHEQLRELRDLAPSTAGTRVERAVEDRRLLEYVEGERLVRERSESGWRQRLRQRGVDPSKFGMADR